MSSAPPGLCFGASEIQSSAEPIEHPVEIPLRQAVTLVRGHARPAAVLVAHGRHVWHDKGPPGRPALALVPQHETPPDVEIPVEAELLVERPAGAEVSPPEGQAVARDRVRVRARSVLEMAEIGRSQAPWSGHPNAGIGQGSGERADKVARGFDAGVQEDDDGPDRPPDPGIEHGGVTEASTRPHDLRTAGRERIQLLVLIRRWIVANDDDR